jgi:ppGpp synthetase/RelA/SpoT-type nucleotidyltranferase
MENDSNAQIMASYDSQSKLYGDFVRECASLITRLLAVKRHRVHSVTFRLKEPEKLKEKLHREGKTYRVLSEVTDIAGVRIITHFEDEVDGIGDLVETEFSVDRKLSIDKRKVLDPDRFGYLSLHYICGLNPERLKLAENCRYEGLVCEIQIRSILQHAWAEIEHDLGYKSDSTVPAPIRRRFSRLAGLLEIGDAEFKAIRDDLKDYEEHLEREIKAKPAELGIDHLSLRAFIRTDTTYRKLLRNMAKNGNFKVAHDRDFRRTSEQLQHVGLKSIEELRQMLLTHQRLIICQWAKVLKDNWHPSAAIGEGLPLLQLILVMLAQRGAPDIVDFFEKYGYRVPMQTNEELAKRIVSAVKECSTQS